MRQIYNSTDNSPEFAELTATTKLSGGTSSCSASFMNQFNEPDQQQLLKQLHHQQPNASHLSLANLLPSRLALLLI
jgi:hypothetical protein